MGRQVYIIGTLDTKAAETVFLAKAVLDNLRPLVRTGASDISIGVTVLDVSIRPLCQPGGDVTPSHPFLPEVTVIGPHKLLNTAPAKGAQAVYPTKAAAIDAMAAAVTGWLQARLQEGVLAGAVGLGGSCGSALSAPGLRSLPLGVPKLLLSTIATWDAAALVGTSDLVLLPTVADISGLNAVSSPILLGAGAAAAGMAWSFCARVAEAGVQQRPPCRPTVGITMFGVTTPCVQEVQRLLGLRGLDSVVFHATGAGGRAMEELVTQGKLQAVLDVTTTEVADLLVGGVMACKESRFSALLQKRIPLVLSVGALDMVNFGPRASVPAKFKARLLLQHNPHVTVMRTSKEECAQAARFIGDKLRHVGEGVPVRVLVPMRGVSALDKEGEPFFDPEATLTLLHELQDRAHEPPRRQVLALPLHINDPEFAAALVDTLLALSPALSVAAPQAPTKVDPGPGDKGRPDLSRVEAIKARVAPWMDALAQVGPTEVPGLKERRRAILSSLRRQIAAGRPVIGAGAGTGISAKCEEQGGVDLVVVYNSGRFRMAGRGSLAGLLPFKDANAVVMEMAGEVLPVVKRVPVLAGVCATDPFRVIPRFLKELAAAGFAGVQNFPTVGLFDGTFRANIEETGMGFALEVDMIAVAAAMGFLTTPYAFNEDEARDMAAAGADVVVAHMGLTTAGSIGARTALTLDQSVARVQAIADAAREVKDDVIVLCHGGPISGPQEAEHVLQRTTGVHGFYGASSMERLPVEVAMVENLKKYKEIRLCEVKQ